MAEGKRHTGSLWGRRRVVAFNRLETRNWELLAALRHGHGRHVMEDLRDALREVTGAKHVVFAPSCRSAIAQILMMLPNEEVVMPAYRVPCSGRPRSWRENESVTRIYPKIV